MDYESWRVDVGLLLDKLKLIDLGYPLGENRLVQASGASLKLPYTMHESAHKDLAEFYRVCDGFEWPDVHIGYFVVRSATFFDEQVTTPNRVSGGYAGSILVLGSTGSGELFAIHEATGHVVLLPHGSVKDRTYDNLDNRVEVISECVGGFFGRLLADLSAFVDDTAGYAYLAT